MTNYEKIKNMTVEEMTEFLSNGRGSPCTCCAGGKGDLCIGITCEDGIKRWLESEVEE